MGNSALLEYQWREKDKQTLKKYSVQGSVEIDENEEDIYRQGSMKECRGEGS